MAKYCVKRNIEALEAQYQNGELFSSQLKKSVFLTILEILFNISLGLKDCIKCFSKKTLKKVKGQKAIVRKILDKSVNLKKRRKVFLEAGKGFEKVIVKHMLKEFIENATEL